MHGMSGSQVPTHMRQLLGRWNEPIADIVHRLPSWRPSSAAQLCDESSKGQMPATNASTQCSAHFDTYPRTDHQLPLSRTDLNADHSQTLSCAHIRSHKRCAYLCSDSSAHLGPKRLPSPDWCAH